MTPNLDLRLPHACSHAYSYTETETETETEMKVEGDLGGKLMKSEQHM